MYARLKQILFALLVILWGYLGNLGDLTNRSYRVTNTRVSPYVGSWDWGDTGRASFFPVYFYDETGGGPRGNINLAKKKRGSRGKKIKNNKIHHRLMLSFIFSTGRLVLCVSGPWP
ncbi:hypothetical protein BDD12DRAFT_858183 [Trichophaea hybrida]|nr:hypothetical protein BDD12DRAFT_858183 [Trichophaea hybrida]